MKKPSISITIAQGWLAAFMALAVLFGVLAPAVEYTYADNASSTTPTTSTSTTNTTTTIPVVTDTSSSTASTTPTTATTTTTTATTTASSTPDPATSTTPSFVDASTTASSTPATTTIETPTSTTSITSGVASSTSDTSTSTPILLTTTPTTGSGGGASDPSASTGGNAAVLTGDAGAATNISNVINLNLLNSNGLLSLLNLFAPYMGNIDLSNLSASSVTCPLCDMSTLATANNSSTLQNDLSVAAGSGSNSIQNSGAGSSLIATGNADAAGNVVNVANTNLTDSNYLLLVLNNFSQLNGDIVLPGASFYNGTATGVPGNTSVSSDNTAGVANNFNVNASTGSNTSTAADSLIATGNANAITNALNLTNMNITGGEPIYVLVRVFGTWNGSVYNTPPGLEWQQTPDGILLTGNTSGITAGGNGDLTVQNTNNANVTNNINVYALTGANEITGGGTGIISTGNANAVGNSINIINTNIVGQNVLLALINIFGDWNGNLSFGQPNLWVMGQADLSKNPLEGGATADYHVTVWNRGSANASNIVVSTQDSDPTMASVTDCGTGVMSNGDSITWHIPNLTPGSSTVLSYSQVFGVAASNPGYFTEAITAKETETDANPTNGTDKLTYITGFLSDGNEHGSELWVNDANNLTAPIAPGDKVHFNLSAGNSVRGGIASGVVLHEDLLGPYGNVVSSKSWPLGTLKPFDSNSIDFQATFASSSITGWYTSKTTLVAFDADGVKRLTATSTVYLVNPADNDPPPTPQIVYVPPPKKHMKK